MLSNLVDLGIDRIHVLVQYKHLSLVNHLRSNWELALRRCSGSVQVVFADHHIYRMNMGRIVLAQERSGAEVSIATLHVSLERSSGFGIVEINAEERIRALQENPMHCRPMPERPGHAFASMGRNLFDSGVVRALPDVAASRGEADFGRHEEPKHGDAEQSGPLPSRNEHHRPRASNRRLRQRVDAAPYKGAQTGHREYIRQHGQENCADPLPGLEFGAGSRRRTEMSLALSMADSVQVCLARHGDRARTQTARLACRSTQGPA